MGSGLATTLQLQAFRRNFGAFGEARTIWMSATVEPEWLRTVDFESENDALGRPLSLDPEKDIKSSPDLKARWEANKPIERAQARAGEDGKLGYALRVYDRATKKLTPLKIAEGDWVTGWSLDGKHG